MKPIYLFEAGGTKTSLIVDDGIKSSSFILSGINPNRYTTEFEIDLDKITIPENAEVYFYGSGLVSEENKNIIRTIFRTKIAREIYVFDDQLGAARAAYGNHAGLIAIMGTGAFAAWYDGEKLVDRKGGHGYLIDDIGGGLELGKIVLSKWLNNDLPKELDTDISQYIKIEKLKFTTLFYKNPDLKLLAELPKLVLPYLDQPIVRDFLCHYFSEFFRRHIDSIRVAHPVSQIKIVGGITLGFSSIITEVALKSGISEVSMVENPSSKLVVFHRRIITI